MKLVSVDRAFKELQNDILFVRLYLILLQIQIYKCLKYRYQHFKITQSEFYEVWRVY